MSTANYNAIVIPGAGVTPELELMPKAAQRMETSIAVWQEGMREQEGGLDMVVTGGYSFMLDTPPTEREAPVMKRYAVNNGVPAEHIYTEDQSLDSVGNALFTKTGIVGPNGWDGLLVVTSRSHLPRTLKAFRHVMGRDIRVDGMPAPENITTKELAYEAVGGIMLHEILRGTKPGDDQAIRERMFDLVPGYAQGTKKRLAIRSLTGLVLPRNHSPR